jgi:RNA polymerase sigma-70 factor (ECF subfamily)
MLSQHAPLATRFLGHLPNVPTNSTTTELDEAQLIADSKRGDAAAYGQLVRKYQDRLCSSLRNICGSVADAQDAAQEAFLRAYLKIDTYSGASAFYTWLYRIAMNIVISEHRRQKTRIVSRQELARQSDARGAEMPAPDQRLMTEERVTQIRQALDKLSSEHRTILVLREMEDCDYDEIASLLAVPVGTVRSRLHRARLELRRELTSTELVS